MNHSHRDGPWVSVVIPAHDEAAVIERCLRTLLDGARPGVEVVVVSDGSSDATATIARGTQAWAEQHGHRVVVEEQSASGKVAAIRHGWSVASTYPRVVLDADVELASPTLEKLAAELAPGPARVATPSLRLDVSGSPFLVRHWAAVWLQLPYTRKHLVGSGVFGVNEAGSRRVEGWPPVLADDAWVRHQFDADESVRSGGHFVSHAPRSTAALVARRARVVLGNSALRSRRDDTGSSSTGDLRDLVRSRTVSVVDLLAFLVVTALTKAEVARRRARRRTADWSTDTTTRQGGVA